MQKFNILIRTLIVCSLYILLGINVMQAKGEKYTIVIDAGHGGKDSGAIGYGAKEKDVNLGVAMKLGEMIKKKLKNVKVVYTRDGDYFVSLDKRAEISNNAKADLFIAIHSNDAGKGSSAIGSEVYVVGYHKDDDSRRVAHRENLVIEIEDNKDVYSGFDPDSDESYIIFEMDQRGKIAQSLKLAELIQRNFVKDAGRFDRGVKQAGFRVLWATAAPSVLIELDFMSNAKSVVYLTSKEGQETLAKCIFDGVVDYLDILEGKKHISFNTDTPATTATSTRTTRRNRDKNTAEQTVAEVTDNTKQKSTSSRRRRDSKSREASNNRNVEVEDISTVTVVAVAEPVAEETVVESKTVAESGNWTSTKPHKQDKDNEKKTKADKKKDEKNKDVRRDHVVKADESKESGKNDKTRRERNTSKRMKFYAIQIVVSDKQLSESDKVFKGYSPVTSFEQNDGLISYTYEMFDNKKEAQIRLKEIKNDFPDAIIVERVKKVTE